LTCNGDGDSDDGDDGAYNDDVDGNPDDACDDVIDDGDDYDCNNNNDDNGDDGMAIMLIVMAFILKVARK
jgi:hypothetical protein